jgi:glycosyltransferase involved in cell wall biosynthesis
MKTRKKTAKSRDLLTLSMIVKDEARTIARTLASVKPFIDRWTIVDTGSSDDTRDVVRRELAGVPGRVEEAPFVDFETTRNLALERCGQEADFILWLDADDELSGGAELRAFLAEERAASGPDREAYLVRVETVVTFDSARVVRSGTDWRFKGVVHEVLAHPGRPSPTRRVPGASIRHDPDPQAIARSHARRERDLGLLAGALQRDPSDARAAFYLAMTHKWLRRWDDAASAFRRRIELGGWAEEVFLAKLGLAEVAESRGDAWSDVLALYLDAFAFAPHRAEPLHRIALHHNLRGEHALCLVFARRALDLPYPSRDVHFVDADVYTWKLHDLVGTSAYWLGEYELGERSARAAVERRPDDARLARNLSYYLDRKK